MKKFLSLLMAVVVLLSMFLFSASKAQAAGLITYKGGLFVWGKGVVFVFEASGIRNKDVKNASIFAGSNFHDLYCSVNKAEGKIVCVARGELTEYAGQTGIIHLAGQIFYVTIPGRPFREASGEEPACAEGSVLGADVTFEDVDGQFFTEFISGDTSDEVSAAANETLSGDPDLVGYEVGDLYCGSEIEPG